MNKASSECKPEALWFSLPPDYQLLIYRQYNVFAYLSTSFIYEGVQCSSPLLIVFSWCFRLIRELFEYTREQAKCSVIFIDEVDSICRQRTSREQDLTRRWVTITYFRFVEVHMVITTQWCDATYFGTSSRAFWREAAPPSSGMPSRKPFKHKDFSVLHIFNETRWKRMPIYVV